MNVRNFRMGLYKVQVNLFRVVAAVVMFGILFGVMRYGVDEMFYFVSRSWIAPALVSPSNDRILAMTAQLVTSQQTLDNLVLDRNRLQESIGEMQTERSGLVVLGDQLTTALAVQKRDNGVNGRELSRLGGTKKDDIVGTSRVLNDVRTTSAQIESDLSAGLITKGDAALQRIALTQFSGSLTDSKIGEVLMRDAVRSKTTTDIDTLTVLSKQADLKSTIAQLGININIGTQQLQSDKGQIADLTRAMIVVKQSPYYAATQISKSLGFAFVPYENTAHAVVGAPVYDCYLDIVACHKVGNIGVVFSDEQRATHPIFKTEIRGVFVQLKLTEQESIKSKTLFIGGKPLFF